MHGRLGRSGERPPRVGDAIRSRGFGAIPRTTGRDEQRASAPGPSPGLCRPCPARPGLDRAHWIGSMSGLTGLLLFGGGLGLVVSAGIWRRMARRRAVATVRWALLNPDPALRRAAFVLAGQQGLARYAD